MGSKNRRPSNLRRVCFALLAMVACFVVIIYIAKKRPELLHAANDPSPIQPLQTPLLDNFLHSLSDVAHKVLQQQQEGSDSLQMVRDLQHRTNASLTWMATNPDRSSKPAHLRWDLVSNADLHIVHKLAAYLQHMDQLPAHDLHSLVRDGYQCSALQAAQQEVVARFISMDICSEIEWYKLVQLTMPSFSTFVDVGANKGYLGSLFLSLWGGGRMGASPSKVFSLSEQMRSWPSSRNPAGYCKDGYNFGIQAHCPQGVRRDRLGACDELRDVTVYSFDGSSYLSATLNSMMREHLSKDNKAFLTASASPWKYANAAVADKVGTARFTKQNLTVRAGFEGGSIQKAKAAALGETEEVPMISIDAFVAQANLTHIDILKIDTEGHDNNVLLGARQSLQEKVSMFTFEGGKGVVLSKEMLAEFDSWGFSCYSTSRAGLFKWNAGCMKDKYTGAFRNKDKGNIFCVSRRHAPMTALAFDALSFPVIIETLFRDRRADPSMLAGLKEILVNANKTSSSGEVSLNSKIDPSLLMPLYINIHRFCKPFPECALVV